MNHWEAKRQAKADRYRELAEKKKKKSDSLFDAAHGELSQIPLGQPILVGHHSEKRHRRLLERNDNRLQNAIEEGKKAKYYADKANTIESNDSIFSDDPEALVKLKEKLAELERNQKGMKEINSAFRKFKKNPESLEKVNISEEWKKFIRDWKAPSHLSWQDIPYPSYKLTINNANIKRVKERIAQEEAKKNLESSEKEVAGVTVEQDVDENRLRLHFPGKPSQNIISTLKRNGFRWSPYNKAWQRHLSKQAIWASENVLEAYQKEKENV